MTSDRPYFINTLTARKNWPRNKKIFINFILRHAEGIELHLIFYLYIFASPARTAQSDKAEIIIFYLYFSPTRVDGAECVYDGQQAIF